MTAIYKGKVYKVTHDNGYGVELTCLDADSEETIDVPYSAPGLIFDPTDDEINNICPDYNL